MFLGHAASLERLYNAAAAAAAENSILVDAVEAACATAFAAVLGDCTDTLAACSVRTRAA